MTSQMSALQIWLLAIRPKILPASIAPILVGSAVAWREDGFHLLAALASLIVAVLLQILSNLANDYFDFRKGADEHRVGPLRVMQAGLVSARQMQVAIGLTAALAIAGGLYLVARGGWPIFIIGLLAVICAVAYTGGPFPLGYYGLGDLFVFLFFGLVGVAGSAYVQTRELTWLAILAAVPIGCLATAIIVANNLRDIETDRAAGKRTLATYLGRDGTVYEYVALIVTAFTVPILIAFWAEPTWSWLAVPVCLPLALPLVAAIDKATGRELVPVLIGTSRLTFIFAAVLAMGIVL